MNNKENVYFTSSPILLASLRKHHALHHISPYSIIIDTSNLALINDTYLPNPSSRYNTTLGAHFIIPHSRIALSVNFGSPPHYPLNPHDLMNLFDKVGDTVEGAFDQEGADIKIPHWPLGNLAFNYTLAGVEIEITHADRHSLRWGELRAVVRGLELYLVDEHRPYRAFFDASLNQAAIAYGYVTEVEEDAERI